MDSQDTPIANICGLRPHQIALGYKSDAGIVRESQRDRMCAFFSPIAQIGGLVSRDVDFFQSVSHIARVPDHDRLIIIADIGDAVDDVQAVRFLADFPLNAILGCFRAVSLSAVQRCPAGFDR